MNSVPIVRNVPLKEKSNEATCIQCNSVGACSVLTVAGYNSLSPVMFKCTYITYYAL